MGQGGGGEGGGPGDEGEILDAEDLGGGVLGPAVGPGHQAVGPGVGPAPFGVPAAQEGANFRVEEELAVSPSSLEGGQGVDSGSEVVADLLSGVNEGGSPSSFP